MVAIAAGAAVAGSSYAGTAIGFLITTAAAIVDSTVIYPALAGDPDETRSPRLLDVPIGSNDPGAPRIWAIGQRVRVPTHVLWQDDKVIEDTVSQGGGILKRGTDVTLRRTFFDCALALNDRYTERLVQLVGNGKLLVWLDRKTVFVRSANMTVAPGTSPAIVVSMSDTLDPDFADKFRSGDFVQLQNFLRTAGNNVPPGNPSVGYWEVISVSPHGSSASTVTLEPRTGQDTAALTAISEQFPQAEVARADDAVVTDQTAQYVVNFAGIGDIVIADLDETLVERTLGVGQQIEIAGYDLGGGLGEAFVGWVFEVLQIRNSASGFLEVYARVLSKPAGTLNPANLQVMSTISSTHYAAWRVVSGGIAVGFFPSDFDPAEHYRPGSDDQSVLSLMTDRLGAGNVSAYRGVAVQGIDDFYVNDFGSQLPFSLEAIIDVDSSMRWPEAFAAVCRERSGIPGTAIDTSGVSAIPFDGFFIRGSNSAGQSMQPMLAARQVVTQERGDKLAFFEIPNADVVQIENGSTLSHLGTRLASEAPADGKFRRSDPTVEELPTSIGVRHQDPDNNYAAGYQHYGLRGPSGVNHAREAVLNLDGLVLSRRAARNLAATTLKRAWINATTYTFELPVCYLHLLENDIVTFTDDDGEVVMARIARRDVGANFLVRLECIAEVLDLPVSGSPVQPSYQSGPAFPLPYPLYLSISAIQVTGLTDGQTQAAGVYIGVGQTGPRWAPATVYEQSDTAGDWLPIMQFAEPTIMGETVEPWPLDPNAFPEGTRWEGGPPDPDTLGFGDDPNVRLPWGSLQSRSLAEVDQGHNWAAVYDEATNRWEIVGFTDATESVLEPGTWRIKVVRRGLRGTWPASMTEKAEGAKFVLLDGCQFRELVGNRVGESLSYKAVPVNAPQSTGEVVGISYTGENATPGAVRSVTRTDNSPTSGDVTISISLRGARTNEPETATDEAPMRETGESFVVSIWDADGLNILRRKTLKFEGSGLSLLRDREVVYTAAEQTEDGYTPASSTIWVSVRQVGEYGNGNETKIQLT